MLPLIGAITSDGIIDAAAGILTSEAIEPIVIAALAFAGAKAIASLIKRLMR